MIKVIKKCRWCDADFDAKGNQKYCCETHKIYQQREDTRKRVRKYRKKYTVIGKNGKKIFLYPTKILGTGDLIQKRSDNLFDEALRVSKEYKKIFGRESRSKEMIGDKNG